MGLRGNISYRRVSKTFKRKENKRRGKKRRNKKKKIPQPQSTKVVKVIDCYHWKRVGRGQD
jgi:hypothetical protein